MTAKWVRCGTWRRVGSRQVMVARQVDVHGVRDMLVEQWYRGEQMVVKWGICSRSWGY